MGLISRVSSRTYSRIFTMVDVSKHEYKKKFRVVKAVQLEKTDWLRYECLLDGRLTLYRYVNPLTGSHTPKALEYEEAKKFETDIRKDLKKTDNTGAMLTDVKILHHKCSKKAPNNPFLASTFVIRHATTEQITVHRDEFLAFSMVENPYQLITDYVVNLYMKHPTD